MAMTDDKDDRTVAMSLAGDDNNDNDNDRTVAMSVTGNQEEKKDDEDDRTVAISLPGYRDETDKNDTAAKDNQNHRDNQNHKDNVSGIPTSISTPAFLDASSPSGAPQQRERQWTVCYINPTHRSVSSSNGNSSPPPTALLLLQQQFISSSNSAPPCHTTTVTGAMGFKTTTKQLSAQGRKQKARRKHEKRSKQRMSSNFLKIAVPVSTSHETYTNLSQIKPMKKKRNTRSTCKNGANTIALKNKYRTTVVKGKYMETSWGGKIGGKKNYQPAQAMSIDNFKTLDSTKDEHIIVFVDSNPSFHIFAKVSRKFAEQHLASKNNIKVLREFAPEIVGAKPIVAREQKHGSINNDYAIIGIRPERLSSNNGVYVFKSHVKPSMKLRPT